MCLERKILNGKELKCLLSQSQFESVAEHEQPHKFAQYFSSKIWVIGVGVLWFITLLFLSGACVKVIFLKLGTWMPGKTVKTDGAGGQWSSLLCSSVKHFRVWDIICSLICPSFVLMFGFISCQINSMPYLCHCISGMMEKRVWSSIPILHISLICGRKKCCRTLRTKEKKRGSRRYIC